MNKDNIQSVKRVLDLFEYLETLAEDRPKLGLMFKKLGISPQTMSEAIVQTTHASAMAIPSVAIQMVNDILKLGVTIGYKYAIVQEMERQFGSPDLILPDPNDEPDVEN